MKLKMYYDLTKHQSLEIPENIEINTINQKDIKSLAVAFLDAYRGTIDYEGETLEETVEELERSFQGEYGNIMLETSFYLKIGKEIVSMIFVFEEDQEPMIGFLTTIAKYKQKGYGHILVQHTLTQLQKQNYKQVVLYVTKGNNAAQRLYEKLGFKETA